MLIVDGHLPLAASALALRRDLTQPVPVLREREGDARRVRSKHKDSLERRTGPLMARQGPATVSLPEMRAGRVGIAVAMLGGRVQTSGPEQAQGARTREAAYAVARSHLAHYRALAGEGELCWIRDVAELDACLGAWERPAPRTHFADQAFWEAVDAFGGAVGASHHNCRALVPGQRQLSDEMIRVIIERDGVIGVACDAWMLDPRWERELPGCEQRAHATLDAMADHVDHIAQMAGSARHCGIGSDLDGGYGQEQSPLDLDTIADLQRFVAVLGRRGYSTEDVRGIFSGNWLRLLKAAWARRTA